ncbi:MAG: TetR/AcrR family transcriptional regulator [Anaerostipes sp.]|nr:TetR/AcrR family transcriptional regulator [Anaerostipes sp.]MDD3745384.1 TetR/AcrR family transcriptional regulator [Anaerostipes sp.]
MLTRAEQAEKTKKDLIDACLHVMKKSDFNIVKVNDIAKQAKVAVGTFYYYYKDKETIMQEVLDLYEQQLIPVIEKLKEECSQEKIRKYFLEIGRITEEKFGLNVATNIYRCQLTMKVNYFSSNNSIIYGHIIEMLEELQRDKHIGMNRSLDDISNDLVSIVRGTIYSWCLMKGSFSLTEKIQRITNSYLACL